MSLDRFALSRRAWLSSAAGALVLLPGQMARAQAPSAIRKNAYDLTDLEWTTFERGVAAMKRIPKQAAPSWDFQANMHGYPPGEPGPILAGWHTCQHGNWWFLPWHRAYLLYFEKIIRAYSGDPGFMLPYWDWTRPDQQSLPARFLNPDSPLYDGSRASEINGGWPINENAVSWPVVAGQTTFSTPTKGSGIGSQRVTSSGDEGSHGAMETYCHDLVHDSIGGQMGNPDTAARDPIFWLHHANVDRLWSAWLRARGGAFLPREAIWLNTPFLFYGPLGRSGYMTTAQLLNTETLGYRYQDYPAMPTMVIAMVPGAPGQDATPVPVVGASPQEKKITIASALPPRAELTSEPLTVMLTPDAPGKARIGSLGMPMAKALIPGEGGAAIPVEGATLQIVIDDIRFDQSPGRFYEAYINLPGQADAGGPGSLYFAGSISFFSLSASHGGGHVMGDGPASKSAVIDATEAVVRLRAAGKLVDDLKVTLIERSARPRRNIVGAPVQAQLHPPRVTIGAIRLQYSGG
ncbi:tyrosinase family protein [Isosphaeraceae bacterium EP7]